MCAAGRIPHPAPRGLRLRGFVAAGKGSRNLTRFRSHQEAPSRAMGELGEWLEEQREAMADRWLVEIRTRSADIDGDLLHLVGDFIDLFTSMLGPGLGAFRGQVETALQQAAELYGNLGAHRGLAAGEPVEEMQLLRGVLLRFLHGSQTPSDLALVGLRDLLQLNRLVDLAVTYASIGHTDTLFFNLFHGTGVAGAPAPDIIAEVREQVDGIQDELSALVISEGREAPSGLVP